MHIISPIALFIIVNQVLTVTPNYWGMTSVTAALLLASVSMMVLFGVYVPLLLLVISNTSVFLSIHKNVRRTIFKQ